MRVPPLLLAAALLAGCATPVVVPPEGPQGPADAPPTSAARGWWWAGGAREATRVADPAEAIARADLGRLAVLWSFPAGGAVTGTPTVADGVVFFATWKGDVFAVSLDDGRELWRHDLGAQADATVALWDAYAFIGDNAAVLHAIDRATGREAWRARVDDTLRAHIYATPLVVPDGAGATLVVPVASDQESVRLHGDAPVDFRGKVVALDARTGAERWRTVLVPEGATGAPVWGSATHHAAAGLVVFGTGNAYTEPATQHTDAVVALRVADGSVAWSHQATKDDVFTQANPVSPDADFGSTPALVDVGGRTLAVLGQKSSVVWALDATTGEVAWRTGKMRSGDGVIGDVAVAGDVVVVPYVTLSRVAGLAAEDGAMLWNVTTAGPAFADPVVSGDVVFVADVRGDVIALDPRTGAELWRGSTGEAGGVYGGMSVAGGTLLVPTVGEGFLSDDGRVVAWRPQ